MNKLMILIVIGTFLVMIGIYLSTYSPGFGTLLAVIGGLISGSSSYFSASMKK